MLCGVDRANADARQRLNITARDLVTGSAGCLAVDALGRWIHAYEALPMGLVWRVCDPEVLLSEACRHAESLPPGQFQVGWQSSTTRIEPICAEIAAATRARKSSLR